MTDLIVGRDGPMLAAGLQFGHVVGQVDVHVFDQVRPVLVGQLQLYHVERGRRVTVVGHVLLLLLLLLIVVVVVVAVLQLLAAVHVLLDLGRHERAEAVRLRRRHELYLAGHGPEPSALRERRGTELRPGLLLRVVVAGVRRPVRLRVLFGRMPRISSGRP